MLEPNVQTTLLALAKRALIEGLTHGTVSPPPLVSLPSELSLPASIFVTLRKGAALCGCLGSLDSHQSLAEEVMETTLRTATEDPRFAPLTIDDLSSLHIEISVLSPLRRVDTPDEIIPGEHGVMIQRGIKRGLFLSQVWKESGWDKNKFLNELCQSKAGLPAAAWKDPQTELWIFTTQSFGSPISEIPNLSTAGDTPETA